MPERFELLARAALLEITPAATVGNYAGETDEGDGVVSVLFDSAMEGYPGWKWTVSIAQVPDSEPTVLEAELMPATGALLAPDWVPWSERLADYKAAQEAAEGETSDSDDSDDPDEESDVADDESDDEDDDLDDDDDSDDDDDDDDDEADEDDILGSDVLHGGDVDGVDIDDLDEDADDDDDDLDDESDDDEDERTY